jgi:hypothetical protein
MTPPLMTVLAWEMTNLSFLLIQGGQQDKQLIEVEEAPPKLMMKLHGSLRAVLWQRKDKQGQAMSFKKLNDLSSLILNTP